jgi:hypothetical protein
MNAAMDCVEATSDRVIPVHRLKIKQFHRRKD